MLLDLLQQFRHRDFTLQREPLQTAEAFSADRLRSGDEFRRRIAASHARPDLVNREEFLQLSHDYGLTVDVL